MDHGVVQDEKLGESVAVLTGHEAMVSFVEFCPVIPHALLSCAFDGTCRIWNATDAAAPPLVLHAGAGCLGATAAAGTLGSAGPSRSTRRAQQAQQDTDVVMLDYEEDEEEAEPAPVPGVRHSTRYKHPTMIYADACWWRSGLAKPTFAC